VIDSRAQTLVDPLSQLRVSDPSPNPPSLLLILNVPVEAGNFKATPELTGVINRNFNPETEKADHEIIGGLSASYKINSNISITAAGAYGTVSNENSLTGSYGSANRSAAGAEYKSNGMVLGIGSAIKAGPGSALVDFKYNNEVNTKNEDATKRDNFCTDLRYAWKIHSNFTVTPRFRNFVTLFPKGDPNNYKMRMENRPELILEGSF
jgi:hypothetical protein